MSILQMNKKIFIKNHPNPKINITENIKIEYVQIAYDDRYIIVNKKDGTRWFEVAKVSDFNIGKILVKALVNDIKDNNKKQIITNDLINFWINVKKYNEVLDLDNENNENNGT